MRGGRDVLLCLGADRGECVVVVVVIVDVDGGPLWTDEGWWSGVACGRGGWEGAVVWVVDVAVVVYIHCC